MQGSSCKAAHVGQLMWDSSSGVRPCRLLAVSWRPDAAHRNVSKVARDASITNAGYSLFTDRNRLRDLDPVLGYPAAPGNRLHPGRAGEIEGPPIGRVDVAGERERAGGADLQQEQHHGAGAG